jgi:hypothetical protein
MRGTRQVTSHPPLAGALAAGAISESWAGEIAAWTSRLPADMREDADTILLEAAAAGADFDDLRLLADAAWQQWKSQRPDPDDDDGGFDERHLRVDTTMDGAGRITGNLTPECAAAVQAVMEALGKRRGKEDHRTAAQRYHDALQEGCELLIRSRMIPGRAGSYTHVDAHTALSQLREMPGAPVLEEAWLAAKAAPHPASEPPRPLPAEAWQALQYALARLAIDFVSGPGGIASVLRTGLLPAPFSDKRPAQCDVHHVKHKKDGGPTSVSQCLLLCQFHHDICIHRWGWEIELLPGGGVLARSPQGQVIRSHSPPPAQAAA